MALPPTARCGSHPEVAAVQICQRCGRFLCEECLELKGDDAFCAQCHGLVGRPQSTRSVVAAGLSGLSVLLGVYALIGAAALLLAHVQGAPFFVLPAFLPGAAGLSLGYQERGRLARGEAAPKSKIYADAAIILGWVDAAMLAVVLALGGVSFFR